MSYAVPDGADFAIDTFAEQLRSPLTDHSDFINVMSDERMAALAARLNER